MSAEQIHARERVYRRVKTTHFQPASRRMAASVAMHGTLIYQIGSLF